MMEYNKTILIVDDEPETLKGYSEFLSPSAAPAVRKSSRREAGAASAAPAVPTAADDGYRLLLAPSGEKALEIVKQEYASGRRVAAGFFDVKLEGGMDGLSTIQAIRAQDKDLHCVIVTAYHDRTVNEIHGLFGEDFKDQWDYLNKPFTQGEIVQKARQMIAAWNRKRQIEWMNAQLVRSERLAGIGQVARGVGHEFGNILLRIMGKADLAMGESDLAKIRDHLKVVLTAAERAGVIVKNLQSVSRSMSAPTNFRNALLTVPVEEALSLVNHELVKSSIQLEKNIKPTPDVRIDIGAMGQVFLNLMINATHAMPSGGKLHVTVESLELEGKAGVAAGVRDTGAGIPEDVLPRIFEFAFTTKGEKGSGLGLAISKEIVESHGGKILVKTQMGKGTEFTVWIPVP